MGSYANAIMVGFVCRLCSEIKRGVIHFFGSKAKELGLMEKMSVLPIKVSMKRKSANTSNWSLQFCIHFQIEKYDNLPKTICIECVEKLKQQYDLIRKIQRSMLVHRQHARYHVRPKNHNNSTPVNIIITLQNNENYLLDCPLCPVRQNPEDETEIDVAPGGSNG